MNTKHDIGRRYNKIVRKIKNFADDYATAECNLVVSQDMDTGNGEVEECEKEVDRAWQTLENYVEQSLRDFRKMIENKEDLP